jgi:hypothetical protein
MTTECLTRLGQRERAEAVDVLEEGRGLRTEDHPTTTVPVMPLWERLRAGVRG